MGSKKHIKKRKESNISNYQNYDTLLEKYNINNRLIMILIFIISMSLLNFQITLTRIFSALFAYHYAFLVISISISGIVIGAIIAHKLKEKNKIIDYIIKKLPLMLFLMGLSFIVCVFFIFIIPFTANIYFYLIFILPVFIFGGILTASMFELKAGLSQKLYFSDLIGAGIGAVVSVFLLNLIGLIGTIVLASIIVMSLSLYIKINKKIILIPVSLILVISLVLFVSNLKIIENNFNAYMSSSEGKSLWRYEKSNLKSKVVYTLWNSFSRTDVIEIEETDDYKTICIDGTGNSFMYKFNGDLLSQVSRMKDNPYYAFYMFKSNKVALIGSGGGGEIIYPLLNGCKDIDAIEINSSTIEAARHFKEYNGNIYDRDEVEVFSEDGRQFISRSSDQYDVIFLSLVLTEIATQSGFMLSEDFIYTEEAFKEYFRHLNNNGRLGIVAHEEPEMMRLITTIAKVLQDKGLSTSEIMDRIIVLNYTNVPQHDIQNMEGIFQPFIIVKNSSISEIEAKDIYNSIPSKEKRILYLPHYVEKGILGDLKSGKTNFPTLIKNSEINIHPVTDDKPYFRVFSKTLPNSLIILLSVMVIIFLIIFRSFRLNKIGTKFTGYFSILGLGYMLIEIPIINKLTLYFGHPIYGYSIGIFLLLFSSGIGSLISNKIKKFNNKKYYLPLLLIFITSTIFTIVFPIILYNTLYINIYLKILIVSIIIVPLGFFLGMPFPFALKNCKEKINSISIPAIWSINGFASVLGSIIGVYASIYIGYTGVLCAGLLLYIILFIQFDTKTFFNIKN